MSRPVARAFGLLLLCSPVLVLWAVAYCQLPVSDAASVMAVSVGCYLLGASGALLLSSCGGRRP